MSAISVPAVLPETFDEMKTFCDAICEIARQHGSNASVKASISYDRDTGEPEKWLRTNVPLGLEHGCIEHISCVSTGTRAHSFRNEALMLHCFVDFYLVNTQTKAE